MARAPLPWIEPADLARHLVARFGPEGLIWLDGDGSDLGRWASLAADPLEQIVCRGLPGETESRDPFAALRELGDSFCATVRAYWSCIGERT